MMKSDENGSWGQGSFFVGKPRFKDYVLMTYKEMA